MAADLVLNGKDSEVYMEILRSSLMIEIKCSEPATNKEIVVRIPEAIACSLAGKISKLVGTGSHIRRQFSIAELMGGFSSYVDLQIYLEHGTILEYLTWFIEWIYTSKLVYKKSLRFFEMWMFALKVECPKLQNEAVKMLGRDAQWRSTVSLEEKKLQYYFANGRFDNSIFGCADISGGVDKLSRDGFEKDGEIKALYWEHKRCLLFLLDCAAYFGPNDSRVRDVTGKDAGLTVMIMQRMIHLGKKGEEMCPWDPKNIARYLVAEPISERTKKAETASLTPTTKRILESSSEESEIESGHKRTRQDLKLQIEPFASGGKSRS